MRRIRFASILAFTSAAVAVLHAGCGSSGSQSGFDAGSPDSSTGDDGPSSSDAHLLGDGLTSCSGGGACDAGGVCIDGKCCPGQNVCGSSCCASNAVCLFDSCVVPGAPCQTSDQCAMGQYCEPALGNGVDAGAPPAPDSGCTSIASSGRCLPIPPSCPGDAGALADGGSCLEQCEYHPSGSGMLNPAVEWQWGPVAKASANKTDVWSTPTVGRMYDTNCDGKIDTLDSPVVVFVSGDVGGVNCPGSGASTCENGSLRMVNGSSGAELWTLDKASASSTGFLGSAPALGDVDKDGVMDIVTMTGEGYVVLVDHLGNVKRTSDKPYTHMMSDTGWGGGLAIADMDLDGFPELTFGDTVWTTTGNAITRRFVGGVGTGGGYDSETSAISDMDLAANGHLELLAGNTCYKDDGTILWNQSATLPDGFPAVGDFNKDGKPEAVLVGNGKVWVLDGATGVPVTWLSAATNPFTLPGSGSGGAPTVADFDGDGYPEIGVAQKNKYTVIKPSSSAAAITQLWSMDNHDFSSAVTGSTVFDFEGDGIAEVVYADECWLWVFSGPTGAVRMAYSHSSFTGTETAMLADINGDGHADMLIPSNGVNMGTGGWDCDEYATTNSMNGVHWKPGPGVAPDDWYRGLVALGDSANSWVGTRTLWTEHTYHVSNVCDDTDTACSAPNTYGSIPSPEPKNWTIPWLNDFRQNVQDRGIFNAPDAVVSMSVDCGSPPTATVSVRNVGQAGLPPGVEADVYVQPGNTKVGSVFTTYGLLPGQTQTLTKVLSSAASSSGSYDAQIYNDPMMPKFHECNANNDTSAMVTAHCAQ